MYTSQVCALGSCITACGACSMLEPFTRIRTRFTRDSQRCRRCTRPRSALWGRASPPVSTVATFSACWDVVARPSHRAWCAFRRSPHRSFLQSVKFRRLVQDQHQGVCLWVQLFQP
jgi:hypothetical protein